MLKTLLTIWILGFSQYLSANIIAASPFHSIFLNRNGEVYETSMDPKNPLAPVALPEKIKAVFAGRGRNSFLLTANNAVYTKGENQYGQLGVGTYEDKTGFTHIKSLKNIQSVAPGAFHTVFLDTSHNVYVTGTNDHGQLGIPIVKTDSPKRLEVFNEEIVAIAAGYKNSFFLTREHHVYASGDNSNGQLCLMGGSVATPTLIEALKDIKAIAVGDSHSLFLTRDGQVLACGSGSNSGASYNGIHKQPTLVSIDGKVKAIAAGAHHSLFLLEDGSVYSVGFAGSGQCGCGENSEICSLSKVLIPEEVSSIAAGSYHSIFLAKSGRAYVTGSNNIWGGNGPLGLSDVQKTYTPITISDFIVTKWSPHNHPFWPMDIKQQIKTFLLSHKVINKKTPHLKTPKFILFEIFKNI